MFSDSGGTGRIHRSVVSVEAALTVVAQLLRQEAPVLVPLLAGCRATSTSTTIRLRTSTQKPAQMSALSPRRCISICS